ncbi:MAG: DUF503 domain-containing protein [Candidatus Latescibacteria bacterium]|nr:DUF503 domain-containing protein [Candidatus Latescibacterota bacterium]
MTLGTVVIQLYIPGCRSLKEKRGILQKLIKQLRNNFNVSVAEVDKNDLHQSAEIAIVVVSNDRAFANAVLSKVVNRVEREPACYMQDYTLEFR